MASHPTSDVADTERGTWDARVATHQRRLMVSLLAEGLGIDDARDISQDAWARLWQQHQAGALESLALAPRHTSSSGTYWMALVNR